MQEKLQKIINPLNEKEFIFDFLLSYDIPKSTVARLRRENSERERERFSLI